MTNLGTPPSPTGLAAPAPSSPPPPLTNPGPPPPVRPTNQWPAPTSPHPSIPAPSSPPASGSATFSPSKKSSTAKTVVLGLLAGFLLLPLLAISALQLLGTTVEDPITNIPAEQLTLTETARPVSGGAATIITADGWVNEENPNSITTRFDTPNIVEPGATSFVLIVSAESPSRFVTPEAIANAELDNYRGSGAEVNMIRSQTRNIGGEAVHLVEYTAVTPGGQRGHFTSTVHVGEGGRYTIAALATPAEFGINHAQYEQNMLSVRTR